ncbi:MAG: hypothetical protein M0Z31_11920 [Clostridia bacterium]|nr:hypothetical protein [Clostridia bacterium]
MILLVLVVFFLVLWLELPKLIRQRWWWELAVFAVIWALALVVSVAQIYDLPLPNPTHGLEYIFKPVSHWFEEVLS